MTSPADPVSPADWDVLVVGAGPAGLAAAAAAAERGAQVAVVDRGRRPGGQYWRHDGTGPGHPDLADVCDRLDRTGVVHLPEHHVQTIQAVTAETGIGHAGDFRLRCLRGVDPQAADPRTESTRVELRARRLVLAPGAYDRQFPFPGWDLPGVLTAGGAQALLKEHGVSPGGRVVVAGTGPFLLPVAAGLVQAGVEVPLVIEANSPLGFALHPRALLACPGKAAEGAGYLARLARSGTRYLRRHAVVRALGHDSVTAVQVARLDRHGNPVDGKRRTVDCEALAVGWGFTAQLELPLQLGCATRLAEDGGLVVTVDADQRTSVPGVWAAGEATGIAGWEASVAEGEVAGASAAGHAPAPLALRRRARLHRFASAMHAVHPAPAFLVRDAADDVVVCRCEEVTVGALRSAVVDLGATDQRTAKLLSRVGMGWCQGRVCGHAAAQLCALACARPVDEADLRAIAERPLATPGRLSDLAQLF